jgi:hypothetical protein
MIDNRELLIKIKQFHVNEEPHHWVATVEFDGEQIYEETGINLEEVGIKIFRHIWKTDSTVPDIYRYKTLEENLDKEETVGDD